MKWIDEIAEDFVLDLFQKSKKETDLEKAKEVHEYISSLTPEELAKEINTSEFVPSYAWREAEQAAYRLMWNVSMGRLNNENI